MVTKKYNGSGTLKWSTPFSAGTGNEQGNDLARDANNNLYVLGSGLNGSYGDILIKYNGIGAHVWNATFSNVTKVYAGRGSVALDSLNNTYMIYDIYSYMTDAYYLAKYNSSGNQSWNLSLQYYPDAVAVDPNNIDNIYVATTTLGKSQEAHLEKYNSSGSSIWNLTLGSILVPGGILGMYDIVVDSVGNITIAGENNYNTLAVVKLTSDGTSLWNDSIDSGNTFYAVAVDSSNNITAVGQDSFRDRWYIQKYASTGTRLWNATFSYISSYDAAYGVAIDSNNSIVVAGKTGGGVNATIIKYYANGAYAWPALTAMSVTIPCPGAYTLRSTTSGIADVNFNC
jgi:hypothetical protein